MLAGDATLISLLFIAMLLPQSKPSSTGIRQIMQRKSLIILLGAAAQGGCGTGRPSDQHVATLLLNCPSCLAFTLVPA